MNLTDDPTKQQLRDLLASRNDEAAAHMMWVDKTGKVYLSLLDGQVTPAQYAELFSDEMQFRFETFQCGNGYVGKAASKDDEHVNDLFDYLVESWQKGKIGYVDY